jgi:hypothetical protein
MSILIGIIITLIYLVFFVDWKEMGEVTKQGGWAAIAVYVIVGLAVAAAYTCEAVKHTNMH